ncbi:MAG: DUF2249 domain-containing protein, partial [Steroidobacteraceae bacterium]
MNASALSTLDVRPILKSGGEPFGDIMTTVAALPPGQGLRLLATFKPVPLFNVMQQRGFSHTEREIGGGDWEVIFTPTGSAPAQAEKIDLRPLPPPQRHALIFATCGKLPTGSAFVLVNDHDPKPLRYQLEAESPGQFGWEYVESGPQVWQVRITRKKA